MQKTQVWSLGWEDPLEEEMATHPSTFAWKIPRTKGPGRLQSTACKKSDTAEPPSTSTHTSNPPTIQRQFLQADLWVSGLTYSLLVSSYSPSPAVISQLSALKGVSCGFPSGVVSATLTTVKFTTREPDASLDGSDRLRVSWLSLPKETILSVLSAWPFPRDVCAQGWWQRAEGRGNIIQRSNY